MGNYLFLVLKGLPFLAARSQSLDTSFQIQKKNSPSEILQICFLAPQTPLSNDFKALGFSDKMAVLRASEKMGKGNCFNTFGLWLYRTFCVSISFSFQIPSICLAPMTRVELEGWDERKFWALPSSSSPAAEAKR